MAEAQHQAQQQASISEADADSGELDGYVYVALAILAVQRHRQALPACRRRGCTADTAATGAAAC